MTEEEQAYAAFGALVAGAMEAYLYDGASAERVFESIRYFADTLGIAFEDTQVEEEET